MSETGTIVALDAEHSSARIACDRGGFVNFNADHVIVGTFDALAVVGKRVSFEQPGDRSTLQVRIEEEEWQTLDFTDTAGGFDHTTGDPLDF